jgi:histone deacetylase 6
VVPLVNTHVSAMQVDAPAEPGASTAAVPPISSAPQLPAKTVGYVWSIEMLNHACVFDEGEDDEDSRHPEQPERLVRIHQTLEQAGCLARMRQLPIRPVTEQEAMLVHTDTHWEKVMAIKGPRAPRTRCGARADAAADFSEQQIIDSRAYYEQLSLYVNNATTDAALLSCGGVVETCLAVARGELQKAFAIVRPPGHHAEPEEHMGFCFFNNVAVATRVLQAVTGIRKIMILDWWAVWSVH